MIVVDISAEDSFLPCIEDYLHLPILPIQYYINNKYVLSISSTFSVST